MPRKKPRLEIKSMFKGSAPASMKEIVRKIIGPIYRNAFGPEATLTMAVDNFFRMGRREVYFARTIESCFLPGAHLTEGGKKILGMVKPKLPKHKLVIVVFDKDDPNVKVEVALDKKDLNVLMTQAEFTVFNQYLRRI